MYIYIYELVAFKTNWYYISNSDKTKPRKKNVYTLLKCFLYSNRNLKKKNVSFTKVADTTLPLGQGRNRFANGSFISDGFVLVHCSRILLV